jgi:hypothetical protein
MRAVQFRNIKKEKRFCCKCESQINARGHQFIMSIERGKYLCRVCENQIEKESELTCQNSN